MISKNDVIRFFDEQAEAWDSRLVRDDEIIGTILDYAEVSEGKDILDVGCGTGVLFPYYYARKAASVTGIDLSPKMSALAAGKFPEARILCGDAAQLQTGRRYDCIVVYNAFPHFAEPERLVENLCRQLKPGGTLTVAHSMSRERVDAHHSGKARMVSMRLMSESELEEMFRKYLGRIRVLSDERMFLVTGKNSIFGAK